VVDLLDVVGLQDLEDVVSPVGACLGVHPGTVAIAVWYFDSYSP
jgi:hypothetical protein